MAVLEALDDVGLPQRLAAVERAARDVGRERGELPGPARRRQRGAAQVVVEVEVGIVDPGRHVEPERHLDESAAERRHQPDPRLEQGAYPLVERGVPQVGDRRRVDDRDAHHVHVGRRRLQREKGRIESGQASHHSSSRRVARVPSRRAWYVERETGASWCSWVFLILAIWGALWTLVSFRPPHRPGFLMVIGFFAAWSTTELAPMHLLWQLVVVVVFVLFGALDSWPGWVGLAITLVSWVGLASSVKGALETDRAFADAMADALGPDWNANLDPQLRESAGHVNWARIVFPFWFRRRGVNRIRNIQYVDDGRKRHRLDVYRSVDVREDAPVLLQIHGGGWMIGNKDQQGLPLMYHLAARGWVCVAINYRLSPRGTWPDHLVDCKRALAWIRAHIAEYGGDPDYVVVTGGSAGGHLTAMMGLTANDPNVPTRLRGRRHVGAGDDPVLRRLRLDRHGRTAARQGPARHPREVHREAEFDEARDVYEGASHRVPHPSRRAAALIVHGNLDTLAPVEEARAFVEKLRATSRKPVVYVELKGAHHAFEVFNSIRAMHAIAGVDLFLAWLLSAEPPGRARARPAVDRTDTAGPAAPASDPTPTAYTERRPARPTCATPGRS